jgi:hypothetical protein
MTEMKKITMFLTVLSLFAFSCAAFGAAKGFSAAELKKMSTFLSNFTELGFMDFDAEALTNEEDPADMIRFGIRHNYINNYKSRIARCKKKDCEWGSLVIEGKYVTETIKKYFDVDYKKLASVTESDPPYYYDGKYYHFDGADGEAVYYARVDDAARDSEGRIVMQGEIYNAEDKNDILGKFTALAKPHKFGGKNTWAILSMETEF